MLFNSPEFIFGFLPVTFFVFLALARWSRIAAAAWLTLASLAFYAWWNWLYLPLLIGSACFNYVSGFAITRLSRQGRSLAAGRLLLFSVAANVSLLGYYKYFNFLLGVWSSIGG